MINCELLLPQGKERGAAELRGILLLVRHSTIHISASYLYEGHKDSTRVMKVRLPP